MKSKIPLIIISIIAVLLVTTLIFAPLAARKYINRNGRELIGRTISLEKIRLNYLSSTIRLIGFRLFEKDDSSLFIKFDTLLVDLQPLHLIRSEFVVKHLWLTNPYARITKSDTLFNFSDMIDFFSATDTVAEADTSSGSGPDFKFALSDIRLKNGNISYIDTEIDHSTILDNLSFTVPYLSWNQKEESSAGLKFNFRNGGYFMADGKFDPGIGDFVSNVAVERLDLNDFTAYIKPYINLKSIDGLADCEFQVTGNSSLIDSISVDGHLSVDSLRATDNSDRKVFGADNVEIRLHNSMPIAGNYTIDTIALNAPYVLFDMHDSTNNFIELMPEGQPDSLADAEADTTSLPLIYFINSLIIRDGVLDFFDRNLREPFKYHLSQISLDLDSISSDAKWVTAYSTMKLNEKGDLKAKAGINPSDPYELKVDYVITNFQLTDISPYSKFYLGSAIVYGNMYYAGKTSITARKITSENKLIIRNAEIGKKSGGLFNIPLRLALYLIKDLNGDIKIDLPVSGDLNDPGIRLGPLVWSTFKNFIVKIAAAPFIALGNLFGIGQKDLQEIDFSYNDTLLTENNIRKLDQLLLIKQKKPELNIELAYFNDRSKEKEIIGLREAGRIFREQTGEDYSTQNENFEAFIRKTLSKDTLDLYADCIKIAGIDKVSDISNYRDSLRIKLVEDYLKSKDTTSSIKIFVPNADAIKNTGSLPIFEVKFSMED